MSTATLLQQQHQQLTALLALLGAESQDLTARDAQQVLQLSQQKQQLLTAIGQLDEQIKHESMSNSDEQQSLLEACNELLRQCQQQNVVNGQAISLSLAGLGRLQQLMAEARGNGAVTYDDKGRTSPNLGGCHSFEV
jgi:flagellar biosynthesis protein FlgN